MSEQKDVAEDFDWTKPDWSREKPDGFWDPGKRLLRTIRLYQSLAGSKNPINIFRRKLCVLRHRFWMVVSGAEIHLHTQIGGGLRIPHPIGIVVHQHAVIGVNCLILQNVTLAGKVELGTHVDIGAGAKILGPLKIGDHARVGANAVVTKDVAEGETVVGIPAKALSKPSNSS